MAGLPGRENLIYASSEPTKVNTGSLTVAILVFMRSSAQKMINCCEVDTTRKRCYTQNLINNTARLYMRRGLNLLKANE